MPCVFRIRRAGWMRARRATTVRLPSTSTSRVQRRGSLRVCRPLAMQPDRATSHGHRHRGLARNRTAARANLGHRRHHRADRRHRRPRPRSTICRHYRRRRTERAQMLRRLRRRWLQARCNRQAMSITVGQPLSDRPKEVPPAAQTTPKQGASRLMGWRCPCRASPAASNPGGCPCRSWHDRCKVPRRHIARHAGRSTMPRNLPSACPLLCVNPRPLALPISI